VTLEATFASPDEDVQATIVHVQTASPTTTTTTATSNPLFQPNLMKQAQNKKLDFSTSSSSDALRSSTLPTGTSVGTGGSTGRQPAAPAASMSESDASDVTAMMDERALSELLIPWSDIRLSEQPVGQGGFGAVYRGSWQGIKVAVKMLNGVSTTAAVDLSREALIMSRVRHPGIATVYGLAADDNTEACSGTGSNEHSAQPGKGVALVMRFYRRGPVSRLLGSLAWADVSEVHRLRMALQVRYTDGMAFDFFVGVCFQGECD
jgi:hypothetical protein